MDNQTLIIVNIILSAVVPIIANSIQECWRFANRVKVSKCCGNEIELIQPVKKEDEKNNVV